MINSNNKDATDEQKKKESDVANQALVFVVSAANDSFQLPIAYYFINSMKASEKKNLLEIIIEELLDCGIIVLNLTFDGFSANLTMCRLFGAILNPKPSFKPYITVRDTRIYIFLDTCHMIKLIRNKFATREILYNENGDKICWQYLVDLVRMKDRGFTLTHKMNQSHINWTQKKMKVELAVQTLSQNSANAIEFLMNEGIHEFVGAQHTIAMMRIFERSFNIFNSKNDQNSNPFKQLLSIENATRIFNSFDNAIP